VQTPIALATSNIAASTSDKRVGSKEHPATAIVGKVTFTQGTRQRNLDITLEYRGVTDQHEGIVEIVMYNL
jgi:hypothetical protein